MLWSRPSQVLLGLLVVAVPAAAQLPAARMTWVFPPGMAAGTTREITVSGSDLDEPASLVFSDPRITASPRPDGSPVFTVVVPPDVPPGLVDVRFHGRYGVSNPRGFQLGQDPELTAPATNTSPGAAFDLPLDANVSGRVQPALAYWFRFSASAGQRVLALVTGRELDSRLVSDLAVFTDARRELRMARRSSVLDFTAPADGTYLLRISDQTFRGGDDYVYRLTLSTRPRVEFALPLTLGEGPRHPVTLFGRNLPGGAASEIVGSDGLPLEALATEFALATNSTADRSSLAAWILRKPAAANGSTEHLAWSPTFANRLQPPLLFARSPFPTSWSVSNGFTRIVPPADFSGAFPRRGEKSGVIFDAKKDAVFWIEISSDRLGFNTDPHLVVQRVRKNENGAEPFQDLAEFADSDTNLGGREFDTTSRDAAGRFKVPEDGTYRILVRDLLRGNATSPRLPYRLQVRPESPDFRLAFFPQPPPRRDDNDRQIHLWTPLLRPGGTLPLRVVAFRRDGFDGAIDLEAQGLPPAVTAPVARIAPGQTTTTLLLVASTNAPASVASVRVTGTTKLSDRNVVRTALPSVSRWHVQDWDQERGTPRFSETLPVAVSRAELAPIVLSPTKAQPLEAVAKTKLRIPIDVSRRGDFQGAFKLKPFGHPALEKAKETDVPEKTNHVVVEIDLAEAALPEGEHVVHFQATVAGKYRNNPEAAEAAETAAKVAAERATASVEEVKKSEDSVAASRKAEESANALLETARTRAATGTDPAAIDERAAAEKRLEEAKGARVTAEARLAVVKDQAKAAEDQKTAAAARAKTATEKAQPKDVSVRVYSAPTLLRITAPPKAG